uniref:BCR4 n=1 Tax=Acyrthosiphon pisum TaxID=7029 RepID=UPI0021C4C980|nr:Chain A, BCR4 [Apis]
DFDPTEFKGPFPTIEICSKYCAVVCNYTSRPCYCVEAAKERDQWFPYCYD